MLLERGADDELTDRYTCSPVWYAALESKRGMAEMLMSRGVSASSRNSAGTPLLHAAVVADDVPIVELKINKGADVKSREPRHDTTALHMAAIHDRNEIARALLSHGAELHSTDTFGETPYDTARRMGNTTTAAVLSQAWKANAEAIDAATPDHEEAVW